MDNQQHRPTWLDLPISFFNAGTSNVPARQTTLRRIATTSYYRPLVEQICAEPDEAKQGELKKQLPAITPVAWLHHRRKETSFADKIKSQWPQLVGDIDRKDNPDVDMAQLKQHLTRLAYVGLCSYSVRGGLWFVIRLPDHQTPETLAAHFRYVQRLFSKNYGVKLDTSKGGNPTDLRYVAYDAAPWLNDSPTVMGMTYTPPKPAPVPFDYSQFSTKFQGRYDAELLTWLVRRVEAATEGNRHTTLRNESRLAGGYIAAGRLDEATAVCALETVASEWPDFRKSQGTIRDGIGYGMSAPLYADVAPARPLRTKQATTPAPLGAPLQPHPRNEEPVCDAEPPSPAEAETEQEQEQPLSTAPVSDEVPVVDPLADNPDTTPRPEPCISATKFHQWQQQHPYFSQMGINSLKHR